jgi:hypothetical protein
MPLTPNTESYQNILSDTAGMTAAEVGNYFEKNKIDKEEFRTAFEQDKKLRWAEESLDSPSPIRGVETTYPEEDEGVRTASGKEPGILPTRLVGRTIGDIGRGLMRIGDAALPEVITNDLKRIAKFTDGYVPEEVKTFAGQVFNPYQGSGPIEPIVGDMISLVLGRGLLGKAHKFAKTGMRYKTGRQAAKLKTTTPRKKGLITPRKARKTRLKGVRREALGWGGSATIVFGPEEDMLTGLMEDFPETFEIFNALAINPDDPKLLQEANALLNNLIIEGSLGGAYLLGRPHVHSLAKKARLMSKSKVNVQETKLSKLHQWARRNMTSRYGIDDTMLQTALRRIYAGNKSVSEADGISQDLVRTVKKEAKVAGVSPKSVEDLMNSALGGAGATRQEIEAAMRQAIDTLNERGFTGTTKLLGRMRNTIDNLSEELTKRGGLVRSDLKATIDANKGIYLNRAYRMFDDPSFTGWDSLSEEVRQGATQYLRKMGVEEDKIEWVLKEILSRGSEGNFKSGMKFLSDMSQKSNKAFLSRDQIPPAIRSLMGEIKDPYKNFARTYEKLSIAKAESDFLTDVRNHLISNNLAVAGRQTRHQIDQGPKWELPTEELNKGLINLQDISEERLGRIIGQGNVKTGMAQNPLENLFVDKNYATFLREGIDVLRPTGPIMKGFLKAKTLTQTSKTVLSPATHFRNVFGNMILMVANGYNPITGREAAFNVVKNRFKGLSSEEFGRQVGRYQELGVMDSSVKAQTIKELASEAFRYEPGTWAAQVMETKAGKATKKVFELYQAEDDFFKIMHFEKTKKQMRKWLPDVPERELEELAAARTRDLMPNYALVPKGVKWLRKSPVSDFAAWPAEVTRVSKNLMKYTWDDWMGNTARDLRARGYNISDKGAATLKSQALARAGWLSAAAMGGDILQQWSMNVMGLGEEDVYDINRLSPAWSQDTAKIFLSPINEDKNKHLGVDFINIGPIDPFSYLKAPARMLVSHMLSDKNLEQSDYNKIGLATYNNLAGPFVDLAMISEAAVAGGMTPLTPEGRQQLADDPRSYIDRLVTTVAKPFIPGAGIMGHKQWDFWQARGARQRLGGEGAMSKYGYTLPEVEFTGPGAMARWAGIRPQRLDISAGLRRNLLPLVKEIDNASARFTAAISNPQGVSRKDAMKAYQDAQLFRLEQFQKLRSMTDTYDHLLRDANLRHTKFKDRDDVIKEGTTKNYALKMNPNLFNYMDRSRKNYFLPFYPSDRAYMIAKQHSLADVPWKDVFNFSRYLEGKTISDE